MKYKAIADKLISDIQNKKLTQGQKLSSLRQFSCQHAISMTTAINCYHYLEQQGWVVSHPQSGFFVSTPYERGDIPKQPQFNSNVRQIKSSFDSGDYHNGDFTSGPFGISQLAKSYLPTLALKNSIKRVTQREECLLHSYSDPQGVYALRLALANHFSNKGFAFSEQDLIISNGCMDAIRMALIVTTKPGDAVAISSPCFNGLLKLLSSMSRKVVEIPCNEDGVDLTQFELLLKNKEITAGLFSSSFMNPHGISLSVEQKQKLAELANTYCVPIIEDDVYGELGYDNAFPLPIKYWDKHGYVLWCSSVSKTLMSGLRIGWCAAGRYLPDFVDLCATECLGHNGLMQGSLADFINTGKYHKHLQKMRNIVYSNVRAYRDVLLKNLPQGSAVSLPRGGLVLWVQVPTLDDEKFRNFVSKAGFDIRFGAQFTTRNLYRDCLRINIGWALDEMYDEQRTIEQALVELTNVIGNALTNKVKVNSN